MIVSETIKHVNIKLLVVLTVNFYTFAEILTK